MLYYLGIYLARINALLDKSISLLDQDAIKNISINKDWTEAPKFVSRYQ